jgi:hypothetical protein
MENGIDCMMMMFSGMDGGEQGRNLHAEEFWSVVEI